MSSAPRTLFIQSPEAFFAHAFGQALAFSALSAAHLAELAPDEVHCALFCAEYDANDIAGLLTQCGSHAALCLYAQGLRNPKIVIRELTRSFPGLSIRIEDGAEQPSRSRYTRDICRNFTAEERARVIA